jgi:hypothetical protein
MTYDERDRGERPDDPADLSSDGGTAPIEGEPAASDPEPAAPESTPEPAPEFAAPEARADHEAGWSTAEAAPAPADEGRAAWSTEPPAAGESAPEAWPTTPPAAGESAPDAWPTTPPERGGEPILEPEPLSEYDAPADLSQAPDEEIVPASDWAAGGAAAASAPETDDLAVQDLEPEMPTSPGPDDETPPPSEVEAYPAAAATTAAAAAAPSGEPAHAVPAAESATGESTQCPRCGTENRPGLAFCRNCGQRLVAAGVAATVERPGTPEGTQACPRCGTHNRAGVAFCQNCGANLRGTGSGYVPPAVAGETSAAATTAATGGAVLGPVVLLIGLVGLITAYLLPFAFGTASLFEQAWGTDGYGIAFWSGYPEGASLAESAYYGLAAPIPILGALLLALAIGGFLRAAPGRVQTVGLVIALIWSVALIVLFVVVELAGNWGGDVVALLRDLSPGGIILFLTSLIIVIGTLTRFARS